MSSLKREQDMKRKRDRREEITARREQRNANLHLGDLARLHHELDRLVAQEQRHERLNERMPGDKKLRMQELISLIPRIEKAKREKGLPVYEHRKELAAGAGTQPQSSRQQDQHEQQQQQHHDDQDDDEQDEEQGYEEYKEVEVKVNQAALALKPTSLFVKRPTAKPTVLPPPPKRQKTEPEPPKEEPPKDEQPKEEQPVDPELADFLNDINNL
jgi:hypothetical protein